MSQIFSNVYSSEMSQEDVLFVFMSDANNPLAVNVLNRLLAMAKTSTNELMSEEEVMTVLGVSRRTLHRLRKTQKLITSSFLRKSCIVVRILMNT